MSTEIRSSYWLIIIIFALAGCDLMEVAEDNSKLDEGENQTITKPVIDVVELGQYGFEDATDINDNGDIVGGNFYWNSKTGNFVDVGFITRALNNHGQVVGKENYWDSERGLVAIDVLNYAGITYSAVHAYDINDNGDVIGEIESCYRGPSWDEIPEDYCEYDFWSMSWNIDERATRELEWFSIAKSINNYGKVTNLSYMYAPHEIYNSFGNFGPYEGYGNGEPNSINDSGQVVGSISIVQNSGNLYADDGKNKEMTVEDKLMRITKLNGLYNYAHVVEMIRESKVDSNNQSNFKGKSGFNRSEFFNEDLVGLWDKEEQQAIVESALTSDFKSEAFIWDEENGIESIGTLNGGSWSSAFDINDHGQVVGYSDIGNGEYRAFYWDRENGMIELPSNGKNSIARAINNKGQIVGENDGPVMWEVSLPQGN